MTRPIYETGENRQSEEPIAEIMALILRSRLTRTRPLAVADYLVSSIDGLATGLMEIKVRHYTPEELDDMGGFFISEQKLLMIHEACRILRLDFHLVVKTTSCLLHLRFDHGTVWPRLKRKFGGRFDRGDSKDAERLCLFPTAMFTRVDDDTETIPARRP